jgi:FMN phosphatase YigB (HAD superfamily)
MIKAIFFDVANTLLDKPDLYPTMKGVLEKHGYVVDVQQLARRHRLLSEIIEFPDKTNREFYNGFNSNLLLMLGILPEPALIDELFNACSYLPWSVFKDVFVVKSLPCPKGIVSNWDRSLRDKLSQLTDISFDWILGSEELQLRKPSLNFYRMVLERSGFNASEILYVGDSIKLDIQPASSLGMRAVLIDRLNLYNNSRLPRVTALDELNKFL